MTERLIDMKWLLADQIQDLTTGSKFLRERILGIDGSEPLPNETIWFIRMCNMFLINSMAKVFEITNHYGKDIQKFLPDMKDKLVSLRAEIESKKIYQYRSKYGSHIIDNNTGRALSLADGEVLLSQIIGKTLQENLDFCDWICPQNLSKAQTTECAMKTVIEARDYLASIVGSGGNRP
ncbi:MAG: hypothetical protein ACTH5D_12975 [Halomonas sp.]|uniref:hypothetical protein n=1 Tax=Halomonas sp. TaxID=1486246 RepID=UPI003F91532E